jgi:pyruvate dehydrogenase E2 component (dihydrolipoamide acetyltransferase)
MAHILIMPRQGNTVESCIITDWKVKEGDTVKAETAVCEVETDKASFEVPAGADGVVLKILYKAGDDVPVLQPIAVVGATSEDWQSAVGAAGGAVPDAGSKDHGTGNSEQGTVSKEQKTGTSSQTPPVSSPQGGSLAPVSPRARNLAEKEALPVAGLNGSGPGGRVIERDVKAALETRPALTAAAKAAGGALPDAGSGIGGRITAADRAEDRGSFGQPSRLPTPDSRLPFSTEGAITESPIKGIRKVISDKMHKSLAESAQFTLNASASAAKLQEIRSRMKASEGFCGEIGLGKITVNDLVLFAVSRLLPRFSFMNAHKTGDTIKTFERAHLGHAVDTPKGLMVPVIRNANLLSLAQISAEAKRLAYACQSGSAKPDELSGSSFTVTNLGSLGITGFTPVLNTPEVAILGVCGIEMKPVAIPKGEANNCDCACNCGFRLEPHIGFSLTINHQVVDGAPAARFLKALCEAIADIDLLLAAG